MTMRANYFQLAPEAIQILMSQETYLANQFANSESITPLTWELIKLRISQINQCAFCIDMHSRALMKQGETIERIIGLDAWRDMSLYTETEKLALDWSEHLSAGSPVDDDRYQQAVKQLGELTVIHLTIAVNAINSWNRVAKTFKPEVGSYK